VRQRSRAHPHNEVLVLLRCSTHAHARPPGHSRATQHRAQHAVHVLMSGYTPAYVSSRNLYDSRAASRFASGTALNFFLLQPFPRQTHTRRNDQRARHRYEHGTPSTMTTEAGRTRQTPTRCPSPTSPSLPTPT
jgi:hypothetical protein